MKVPEWAFAIVNPIVRLLLSSPLHGVMSSSVMAIRYVGRKSGREFVVPVRYIRDGDDIIASTGTYTGWWRNFLNGHDATLRLAGESRAFRGEAIHDNDQVVGPILREILRQHPDDAVYMDITMTNGQPDEDSLLEALSRSVIIRFTPATSEAV